MNDPLDLKKFIRTVNDFPIDGIVFRDITSLIETPEAFIKTCDELTKITKEFNAEIVASIEKAGIHFCRNYSKRFEVCHLFLLESQENFQMKHFKKVLILSMEVPQ